MTVEQVVALLSHIASLAAANQALAAENAELRSRLELATEPVGPDDDAARTRSMG